MAVDQVEVNISVQAAGGKRDGFGVKLILDEHTAFVNRTKSYTSLAEVLVDFAATTKVYKAAFATFSQDPSPATVKIGRIDATDTSLTDSLTKIYLEDSSWYELEYVDKSKPEILLGAAWIEANGKIYGFSSEDANIFDSADATDTFSVLNALSYKRTFGHAHHQAGVDSATGSITVILDEVVTVTDVGHGLRVNDNINVTLGADAATNGNFLVASVIDADNFTFVASGAIGAPAPADPIEYYARYEFIESALSGVMLPKDPGADTWANQQLAGQVAIPTTVLNSSEIAAAEAKGANVYILANSVPRTRNGIMVDGSTFIDVTRGVDWLDANMEADIDDRLQSGPVPYTNKGGSTWYQILENRLNIALDQGVINPLSDEVPFEIFVPNPRNVPVEDRALRKWTGITFRALVGDKVHGVIVNGTLEI